MVLNVGYSIGWGGSISIEIYYDTNVLYNILYSLWFTIDIKDNRTTVWFSIFYVLCGASFVVAGLSIFSQRIAATNKKWYEIGLETLQCKKLEENKQCIEKFGIRPYYKHYRKLGGIIIFVIVLFTATAFACHHNDWYFAKGLYFSLTSMSTGGLVSLPDDAGSCSSDF